MFFCIIFDSTSNSNPYIYTETNGVLALNFKYIAVCAPKIWKYFPKKMPNKFPRVPEFPKINKNSHTQKSQF